MTCFLFFFVVFVPQAFDQIVFFLILSHGSEDYLTPVLGNFVLCTFHYSAFILQTQINFTHLISLSDHSF